MSSTLLVLLRTNPAGCPNFRSEPLSFLKKVVNIYLLSKKILHCKMEIINAEMGFFQRCS